jgi:hypothetical protein
MEGLNFLFSIAGEIGLSSQMLNDTRTMVKITR